MALIMRACILAGLLLYAHQATAQPPYKFAFTGTAPVTQKGYAMVECAFDKAGIEVQFLDVPWKRAQAGTQSGSFAGFFLGSQTSERAAYSVPSDPVYSFNWYYVLRKGQGLTPDHDAFFTQVFGANQGTARLKWLEKKLISQSDGQMPLNPSSIESAWSMLRFGRIDVLLANETNIKKHSGTFDVDVFPAVKRSVHVHFSSQTVARNPNLLSGFNQGLMNCNAQ